MRRVLGVLVMLGLASAALASQSATVGLREQLTIQKALLDSDLRQLEDHQARLQDAWIRVEREAADLLQAQQQGESLDSLKLRDEDLRRAESELLMHMFTIQRQRQAVLAGREEIQFIEDEIIRLEGQVGTVEDPLSGTWRLVIEPGGQEGYAYLRLDGTLVQGTYQLAGDWSGSLRGTFVSGKVRMERIDSAIGFAAILYGRLAGAAANGRLEGTWEATQLARGLPSGGTWFAERVEELDE